MKKFSITSVVEERHIDKGGHANFALQLLIAAHALEEFRKTGAIGIERLREDYDIFLFMRRILFVEYYRELFLHDVIQVELEIDTDGPCTLKCSCKILRGTVVATEMQWVMVTASPSTKRPKRIPTRMREIIRQPVPPATT